MRGISRIILKKVWGNGAVGIIPLHMLDSLKKMNLKERDN